MQHVKWRSVQLEMTHLPHATVHPASESEFYLKRLLCLSNQFWNRTTMIDNWSRSTIEVFNEDL